MPFTSSAAPELRLELNDSSNDTNGASKESPHSAGAGTEVTGRLVVHAHKTVAIQGMFIEFVGEESVSLRAWVVVPLGSNTVSREVLRQRVSVRGRGELREGTHEFGFTITIPPWVPSSLERDMCRIRYVVRASASPAATLLMPFGIVSSSGSGGGDSNSGGSSASGAWTVEREIRCRRIRVSRRLARRKCIDQSVGCPDGSCHVRFCGSLSRDIAKPGTQLKLDVAACTSDARYGLRLLVANFAECVMCHVQVKGEERLVNKITNLTSCRLSNNAGDNGSSTAFSPARPALGASRCGCDEGGSGNHSKCSSTAHANHSGGPRYNGSAANHVSSASAAGGAAFGKTPRNTTMAQQMHASHVIHVPHGLSQFSSDYVSREYRLILVAEVYRIDTADDMLENKEEKEESKHLPHLPGATTTFDSFAPASPSPAASTLSFGSSVVSLPSSLSSSAGRSGLAVAAGWRRKRQQKEKEKHQLQQQLQQQQHQQQQLQHHNYSHKQPQNGKLSISDQSSAIASWPLEIVDHFDLRFDDLVSPDYKSSARQPDSVAAPTITASEARVQIGKYRFVPFPPPLPLPPLPSQTVEDGSSHSGSNHSNSNSNSNSLRGSGSPGAASSSSSYQQQHHHRRTSSGLVGYLIRRGLRSITPSSLSPKEQQNGLDTVATAPPEVADLTSSHASEANKSLTSFLSPSSPRRLHRKARSNSAPFRSKQQQQQQQQP
ncbi:hypothetical protein LPJ72_002740 [Coemansia sp. Benny D160-2]|nr:hypothetical protein LPJ72_002740 [Coemansia sp. Benny D160-2]